MTAKQQKLQAQAGSCANLDTMFRAAKNNTTTPAAAAAANDITEELDENSHTVGYPHTGRESTRCTPR